MAQPEPNKVIYSMVGVSKFHGKKQVLKDIYLSYFYGAKIGVIGLNGSGKSSLLRILAGEDQDHLGETVLSPGHTVGFLQQEPDRVPRRQHGLAEVVLVFAGQDAQQRRLAGSVQADDADLRAIEIGEVDVLEDLFLSMELRDADHGVD